MAKSLLLELLLTTAIIGLLMVVDNPTFLVPLVLIYPILRLVYLLRQQEQVKELDSKVLFTIFFTVLMVYYSKIFLSPQVTYVSHPFFNSSWLPASMGLIFVLTIISMFLNLKNFIYAIAILGLFLSLTTGVTIVNYVYDDSEPMIYEETVLDKQTEAIDEKHTRYLIQVGAHDTKLEIMKTNYDTLKVGDEITIIKKEGFLDMPYWYLKSTKKKSKS